jgi:DinB superfamily
LPIRSTDEHLIKGEMMQAKDAIQFVLNLSHRAVLGVFDELSDAPTTFPTLNGGCHPLWVLGHLALIEGAIPSILFGDANPVGEWQTLFGEGSEPQSDARFYPDVATVRAKYVSLREQNLKVLDSLTEAELDLATKNPPKEREKEFATFGRSFLTLAAHQAMHRSHLTDAKRAAARHVPTLATSVA